MSNILSLIIVNQLCFSEKTKKKNQIKTKKNYKIEINAYFQNKLRNALKKLF